MRLLLSFASILRRLKLKAQLLLWLQAGFAGALVGGGVHVLAQALHLQGYYGWLASLGTATGLLLVFRPWHVTTGKLEAYVNQHVAPLEHSASLLGKEATSLAAAWQNKRLQQVWPAVRRSWPHWQQHSHLTLAASTTGVVLALVGMCILWLPPIQFNRPIEPPPQAIAQAAPLQLLPLVVQVVPPAYTHQRSFTVQGSFKAPQGSKVRLHYPAAQADLHPRIVSYQGDSLPLQPQGQELVAEYTLNHSIVVYLKISNEQQEKRGPLLALEAVPDEPPQLRLSAPPAYQTLYWKNRLQLLLAATATDDYGLAAAQWVLTLTHGSGEAVRFEQRKLPAAVTLTANPKNIRWEQQLNLHELELAPGDELYGYLSVADNAPTPHEVRSETWIVAIEDTAQPEQLSDFGLPVSRMPEYFRSQRQLIIDTEKLISERPKLPADSVTSRSNDIGIDQKLLRLRYGQFLGEEFENAIGEGQEEHGAEDHTHAENPSTSFGALSGEAMEQFIHRHDVEEQATFFADAVKADLKACLAQMWEAELRLRTTRPNEALPFEYQALALLKQVQQKSRVYVRRVGFTTPPLHPIEKRLTGELGQVKQPLLLAQRTTPAQQAAVRLALVRAQLAPGAALTPADKRLLLLVGQALATAMLQNPAPYLTALEVCRAALTQGRWPAQPPRLTQALQYLLPTALPTAGAAADNVDVVAKAYLTPPQP